MRKILLIMIAILGVAVTSCEKSYESPLSLGPELYSEEYYGLTEDEIVVSEFQIVGSYKDDAHRIWKVQQLDSNHRAINVFVIVNDVPEEYFKKYKKGHYIFGWQIHSFMP